LLLPALTLSRLRQPKRLEDFDPELEHRAGERFQHALERVMDLERLLIEHGLDLPVGGSLLAVAVRP